MSRLCFFLSQVHSFSGPVLMLLYPLYASVMAIESPTREDDEQWLAYWILYSFLTLTEIILQSVLELIPIWYTVKLILVAWLALPQFKGAAFIYERFVRRHVRKFTGMSPLHKNSPGKAHSSFSTTTTTTTTTTTNRGRNKFLHFLSPNKGEHE